MPYLYFLTLINQTVPFSYIPMCFIHIFLYVNYTSILSQSHMRTHTHMKSIKRCISMWNSGNHLSYINYMFDKIFCGTCLPVWNSLFHISIQLTKDFFTTLRISSRNETSDLHLATFVWSTSQGFCSIS